MLTLDEISLDAVNEIKALPDDLHEVQKTARTQLIIFAAITRAQAMLPPQLPRWRHKISDSIVTEIGRGHAQCSATFSIHEMDPVVIYSHEGEWWVRHVEEFDDGRFESVP